METILAYAFDLERYIFFSRFNKIISENGGHIIVITDRLSIKQKDVPLYHIKKVKKESFEVFDEEMFSSLEYAMGYKCKNKFDEYATSLDVLIEQLNSKYNFTSFFIWNGSRFPDKILTKYAIEHKIKRIYFENSNFRGRMIADSQGVNSASLLGKNPNLIKKFDTNTTKDFDEWRTNYIKQNLQVHLVSQSSGIRKINWKKLFEIFSIQTHYVHQLNKVNHLRTIINKLISNSSFFKGKVEDEIHGNYVFYPFQVATDTQVLLNSSTNNLDALEKILNECPKDHKIVVKQHPAEPDKLKQIQFKRFLKKHGIIESRQNTFKLILGATRVYTINSTVGIQSIICGTPIRCFGNAIFSDYSLSDIKNYIFGYLVKMDSFSDAPITKEEFKEIISRVK